MQSVTIAAPASKSLSHRLLMAAALANGESHLTHVLESDDTARTRDILTALGASFTRTSAGAFTVTGTAGRVTSAKAPEGEPLSCFVGESGTTCRLIAAILAAGQGSFRIHGAGRMHERPIGELAGALTALGAGIRFEEKEDCPPVVISANGLDSSRLPGSMAVMGCDASSQYLSGLLLAAPLGRGLTILLGGTKAVSWPYVSLTLETLERFGIPFQVEERDDESAPWREISWRGLTEAVPGRVRFIVKPAPYKAGTYAVEGDWSGASYFLAAGAIGPRAVTVAGLRGDSLQGDAALLDILEQMGAKVERGNDFVTVHPSILHGIEVDMGHCPDLVPTVAALAAHATGATIVRGAAHLKIKESDRLHAPAQELAKIGCVVMVTTDGLVVAPPPKGIAAPAPDLVFSTHEDHRMAMSLALLGLAGTQGGKGFAVALDTPDCVAKSFPHFWQLWDKITG